MLSPPSDYGVDQDGGLVLVLLSSTPVTWRLAFVGVPSSSKLTVALSRGSSAVPTNARISSTLSLEDSLGENVGSMDDANLAEEVRIEWGAVTSFASAEGANRISILMPEGEEFVCTISTGIFSVSL